MATIVIITIGCLVLGSGSVYMLFKYGMKNKRNAILQEAQNEAETIKRNKLLEVKEKFLNKKAELEKEVTLRNQRIQQAENKLKQRELMLKQRKGIFGAVPKARKLASSKDSRTALAINAFCTFTRESSKPL